MKIYVLMVGTGEYEFYSKDCHGVYSSQEEYQSALIQAEEELYSDEYFHEWFLEVYELDGKVIQNQKRIIVNVKKEYSFDFQEVVY